MKESILNYLQEWEESQGLVGFAGYNVQRSLQEFLRLLQELKSKIDTIPKVILVEPDPRKFISYFFAGIISEVDLFLGDPNWQTQEWEQVFELVKPDLIWGDWRDGGATPRRRQTQGNAHRWEMERWGDGGDEGDKREESIIGIPTGGSSGKIRFAVHTLSTLTASVNGFAQYFETETINSCCTLPLYHVSGLMQLWRCFLTQGKLAIFPYKSLKQGKIPNIDEVEAGSVFSRRSTFDPEQFFISLVPTQLKLLLGSHPHWLAKFHAVLLGGAPAWRSLLDQARDYNIKLCPTYGMTETASGVVYLKSQDFLNHNNSSGRVLPHANLEIINNRGKSVDCGQIGTIKIQADSLFCGYYPEFQTRQSLITDDLGYFDQQGFLYIVGRNSQKIITGGKNVFPVEVETAIFATGLVKDICVIGLNDEQWGQIITAIFVPTENFDLNLLKEKLHSQLSKYKHPKNWLEVASLPRCDRGKINYPQITQIVLQKLKS